MRLPEYWQPEELTLLGLLLEYKSSIQQEFYQGKHCYYCSSIRLYL